MKRIITLLLAALPLFLSANTDSWEATEAFAEKGLLIPFTSIDGLTWTLSDSGITISFNKAAGAEYPDMARRPEASAWLYPGNELRITAPDEYELTEVTVYTMPDTSFIDGAVSLSSGIAECDEGKLTWRGKASKLTIGPADIFDSIHETGARAAVTTIYITYGEKTPEDSGITELRLPHSRAALTIRNRHLHIICGY